MTVDTANNERTASAVLLKFLVGVGGNVQDEILDLTVEYAAQIVECFGGDIQIVLQAVQRTV